MGRSRSAGCLAVRGRDPARAPGALRGARVAHRRRSQRESAARGRTGQATPGGRRRCGGRTAVGRRVTDPRQRVQQLLAGPRTAAAGPPADIPHRRSQGRPASIYARRQESGRASQRTLRRRAVRVLSRSRYRRALSHRRGHRTDVARPQRWTQPDRAEPWLRHDPPRGISRPACHPDRRTPPRQHPAMVRRRCRQVGGLDLRRRHDQLHRSDELRVGDDLHASVRDTAHRRALHSNRPGRHGVPHHGGGSDDIREAVDGGDSDHEAGRWDTDLRVRLPRGQLRDDATCWQAAVSTPPSDRGESHAQTSSSSRSSS